MMRPMPFLRSFLVPFLLRSVLCSSLCSLLALACAHASPLAVAAKTEELTTTPIALPALAATVTIDLDKVEVPTITAASITDAACAQGWLHARERFLQMDLARREAAGELGEIVPAAVEMDRVTRCLQLRVVAERAVALLPHTHREILEHYSAGVNAQLAARVPLEYQLMKLVPSPWTPADSMLIQLGMARYLDSSPQADRSRACLFDGLAPALATFFSSSAGPLDMSVDGSPLAAPPALPTSEQLNLRASVESAAVPATEPPTALRESESNTPSNAPTAAEGKSETHPGSNAFAIAGSRTQDGRAIVGNDMHLALMAPGIWYRVRLEWTAVSNEVGARKHELTGLSLPGVPLIVQGTNGFVAWAFTNLTADLTDLVVVEVDPNDSSKYLVEGGSESFVASKATLGSGNSSETIQLRATRFGPIIETRDDGRMIALRWAALDEGGLDCGLFNLASSQTLDDALAVAREWHGPPQNILIASADGRIGWTIAGTLPARSHGTSVPVSWRSAPQWSGIMDANDKPTIVDPPSGVLTSANQLSMQPTGALATVLGRDEAAGDRAYRLRELLEARHDWTEAALHSLQLDTRSARLLRWRDALLAACALDAAAAAPPAPRDAETPVVAPIAAPTVAPIAPASRAETLREVTQILSEWQGATDAGERAPVLLDQARSAARKSFARGLATLADMRETGATERDLSAAIDDEAMLRILESRCAHLLPPDSADWPAFARALLEQAAAQSRGKDGAFRTRGDDNRAWIRHPAADALGAAARVAEMPKAPLPGHPTAVRVQTPTFGASERSVVSPTHLNDAILVTPCGQSGLPTSPHFRSLHRYWQDGLPYPLLPGAATQRLELMPSLPPSPVQTPNGRDAAADAAAGAAADAAAPAPASVPALPPSSPSP